MEGLQIVWTNEPLEYLGRAANPSVTHHFDLIELSWEFVHQPCLVFLEQLLDQVVFEFET